MTAIESFRAQDIDAPAVELHCRKITAVGVFEVTVEDTSTEGERTVWLRRDDARKLANYITRELA